MMGREFEFHKKGFSYQDKTGAWKEAMSNSYTCEVKSFNEPSEFGLANSRISKMSCWDKYGNRKFHFERELVMVDIKPNDKELTELIDTTWDILG